MTEAVQILSNMKAVPPFVELSKISTTTATSSLDMLAKVKENLKRGLPRLHNLPEFQKIKGNENPIVLVGGGPSLKNDSIELELRQLSYYSPIIACGSSFDWLVENGTHPTYVVICDPDAISADYLKNINSTKDVKFLVASCCDKAVFEALEGEDVYLWHCHGDETGPEMAKLDPEYQAICGGCTVGLRSISIAMMLGYSNIHLFGFDSSLSDSKESHAYPLNDPEKEPLGTIHQIKIGVDGPQEKIYNCIGYQIAQADHFREFYKAHYMYFTPTFHGEGLLPDMFKLWQQESLRLQQEAAKL